MTWTEGQELDGYPCFRLRVVFAGVDVVIGLDCRGKQWRASAAGVIAQTSRSSGCIGAQAEHGQGLDSVKAWAWDAAQVWLAGEVAMIRRRAQAIQREAEAARLALEVL